MKKISLVTLFSILIIASFLRLWKLDKVPVSLFGDELDAGYQAYSVLKTGKDYYGNFLPVHFHSLAEWRTPLYLYSAVPTVALLGITAWGVRLPAAIFGILGVLAFYLLIRELFKSETLALVGSFLLAISPWHIQYSRAGFEVTLMLWLFFLGLYYFFKALKDGKWLWLSVFCLVLTPWVYSTAKLFTPMLLIFLTVVWRKEIFSLPKKYLIYAALAGLLVGIPITYSTIWGGGTERFSYIGIFTDPTMESEVGTARLTDARMRGETGAGLKPTLSDRLFHNKFTFAGGIVLSNYLQAFSTDFLFIKGDPDLRQSIGTGEFYRIEIVPLLLGVIFFFTSKTKDKKIKALILFWILAGVIPSALTRDGGNHATRLILILPPLIFLISYGLVTTINFFRGKNKLILAGGYGLLLIISFVFYQHEYWIHYPWNSERWWHAGFQESFYTIKNIEKNYNKVVITTADEPPWIFFAGWYEYSPIDWQTNFPLDHKVNLPGFGDVSHIGKFYFGSPSGGLYDWGKVIDSKTLYLASEKEVKVNLIMEPDRTPGDLKLIKAIAFPSGDPAYYIFSGVN